LRLTIGLGAVTVISGSWAAGGGAASCDIALLLMPQSTSQLAPPMWKARLTKNAMNQILIKKLRLVRRRQRIRKRLPSMCDGPISIYPPVDRPRITWRSH
jgi:hypothetical protein